MEAGWGSVEVMALTLAEELTLLAYDVETGKSTASMYVEYGLGGALLAELAILGNVSLTDMRVTVADTTPSGDPLLDETLAKIADSPPRKPQRWVEQLRKGAKDATLRRLVERGLLREEKGRALLVFPSTTYPTSDARPEREVRQRLHDAVVAGRLPEARTVTLALLVNACDMSKDVFPELPKKELKRRLNELTAANWAAVATKQVIERIQAAVLVTVTTSAATITATGSS